ncbi:MAG: peptidase U32 family protein [Bacteroidota bacterium]
MKKNRTIEIMSPAGSYESLMAAIQGGADSVYFGVEQLNMRARSSANFTLDDLIKISKICQDNNVRSYITLNTIIYDRDISLVKSVVDKAKENNISAIIASDHAVFNYTNKVGMEVHVSTQCNISNIEAVKFYAKFSDVMILARELSLEQVAAIIKAIEKEQIKGPSGELVRIEIFAHGALCMSISGKCYLSLHSHNASANRGSCFQDCRREYIVKDKEEGHELLIDNEYIMSPKDLCTIGFLNKIIKTGVDILKIEGRGRSPDYVKTVTQCYREAVDSCFTGTYSAGKIKRWEKTLSTVFNRGFWDGYYLGKKMGEWTETYGSQAIKRKIYIGRGIKYFDKVKVGEFKVETNSLSKGDQVLITGPTTGVIQSDVKEIRIDDTAVERVIKGDVFSMPVPEKVRASDKLYKFVPAVRT